MKSMLEEYGKIVVVSIVIAIMIGAAALLRGGQIELPFQKITKLGSDEFTVATTGHPKPPETVDNYDKFIIFLHYPPTTIGEQDSPFTKIALEYNVSKVIYSHCHGKERFDDSFKGYVDGIEYKLVSGDYLNFKPELILP